MEKIEGAHQVRLVAEKEDNKELKRRLSKLTNVVRRQTLKGDNLVAAAAIAASGMDASQASFDAQSMLSADAITTPEITPEMLRAANAEQMRKWIAEFQEN